MKPDNGVTLFTDGACLGNPGPGGYGVILEEDGKRRELSGGFRLTTNNRMELMAAIVGLSELKQASKVRIFSDSTYVVNSMKLGWARQWRRTGYKKKKNPDLWERLLTLADRHSVEFIWVEGHAGHPENERCDQLSVLAAQRRGLPADEFYEKELASGQPLTLVLANQTREPSNPMESDHVMLDETHVYDLNRRRHGLIIGLAAGLVFGLISNGANPLLLNGIPLYQPPFGLVGNTILWAAICGLLGAISAWPNSSIFGVVIASLAAGLMLQVSTILSGNTNVDLWKKIVAVTSLYFPFSAMASPLTGLLRWSVNEQREWYQNQWFSWKRLRVPLMLMVVTGGLGALWIYPPDGQETIRRMHTLVQQGLQSASPANLPPALQDPLVGSFQTRAAAGFSLDFTRQDLNRFMIPYAPMGDFQPAAAIARFSTGWSLVCLYVNPAESPFCKGFDRLER